LDVYETDEEIQLVTEYCRGGELFDAIQQKRDGVCPSKRAAFCEAQGARIASQILSVLKELHEKNIVHRDVKPENILLTSRDDSEVNVKLCDFGLARLLSGDIDSYTSSDEEDSPMTTPRARAYSTAGSDLYAAPEVCVGAGYNSSADIYSLGVTLYVVLSGIPPSYFDIGDDLESSLVSFPPSHWKGVPQDAQELIRLMLDPYPHRRISAAAALDHNWIVRCNKTSQRYQPASIRISRASLFSPSNPRPVIDLELVRTRLYTDMDVLSHEESKKTKFPGGTGSRKRSRRNCANSETTLAAMVDLLEDVAASATAAGVVYYSGAEDVHVNDFDDDDSDDPLSLAFFSV
jgi:calcium-dependent protein kinase